MSTKVRTYPTVESISVREAFLKQIGKALPLRNHDPNWKPLEYGNSKIGYTGRSFKKIFVWNLPAVSTCPGATNWCLRHCYNADTRLVKFPHQRWLGNWGESLYAKERLIASINKQLSESDYSAVRIHSSGDFYSKEYIRMWITIVENNPKAYFWAYTRSWRISGLEEELVRLNTHPNVSIFASVEGGQDCSPNISFRRCTVAIDEYDAEQYLSGKDDYRICPEQLGKAESCGMCEYCMKSEGKNIIFLFH